MANFGQSLANAGNILGSGMETYDTLLQRKRAMELADLQRRALMQQEQQRAIAMQREEQQRQAQGQAFSAMGQPQGMQPGAAPMQVPVAGAQPMPRPPQAPPMPTARPPMGAPQPGAPPAGGPPPAPGAPPPGAAPPPGPGAAAPPAIPPHVMAAATQGLTPNAFDVGQLVAQINKNPATKDLPDDQKFLVLQNMQGALSGEGKAQLEILKQQHTLEIAQLKLDAAADRLKDNEQFRLLYEGVRQKNRSELAGQQDDARGARLKARLEATAAEKEAKKPLEGLKADRTEINDEVRGIRAELTELGTGLNQPQPGSSDYNRMLELRSQLKDANTRLQEIDQRISQTARAPAAGAPGAAPAPSPSTKFEVGKGYTDADGNTMYYTGKNAKDPHNDANWSDTPPGE